MIAVALPFTIIFTLLCLIKAWSYDTHRATCWHKIYTHTLFFFLFQSVV